MMSSSKPLVTVATEKGDSWISFINHEDEDRFYMEDEILPTLVPGLIRILKLHEQNIPVNPYNYLGQYLMRNNPKYVKMKHPYSLLLKKHCNKLRPAIEEKRRAREAEERRIIELKKKQEELEKRLLAEDKAEKLAEEKRRIEFELAAIERKRREEEKVKNAEIRRLESERMAKIEAEKKRQEMEKATEREKIEQEKRKQEEEKRKEEGKALQAKLELEKREREKQERLEEEKREREKQERLEEEENLRIIEERKKEEEMLRERLARKEVWEETLEEVIPGTEKTKSLEDFYETIDLLKSKIVKIFKLASPEQISINQQMDLTPPSKKSNTEEEVRIKNLKMGVMKINIELQPGGISFTEDDRAYLRQIGEIMTSSKMQVDFNVMKMFLQNQMKIDKSDKLYSYLLDCLLDISTKSYACGGLICRKLGGGKEGYSVVSSKNTEFGEGKEVKDCDLSSYLKLQVTGEVHLFLKPYVAKDVFYSGEAFKRLEFVQDLVHEFRMGFQRMDYERNVVSIANQSIKWLESTVDVTNVFLALQHVSSEENYTIVTSNYKENVDQLLDGSDGEMSIFFRAIRERKIQKEKKSMAFPVKDIVEQSALGVFGVVTRTEINSNMAHKIGSTFSIFGEACEYFGGGGGGEKKKEEVEEGNRLAIEKVAVNSETYFLKRLLIKCRSDIHSLTQSHITELINYKIPPKRVHRIIRAILYLFNYKKKQMDTWMKCRGIVRKMGLIDKLQKYDPTRKQFKWKFKNIKIIMKHLTFEKMKKASYVANLLFGYLLVVLDLRDSSVKLRKKVRLEKRRQKAKAGGKVEEEEEEEEGEDDEAEAGEAEEEEEEVDGDDESEVVPEEVEGGGDSPPAAAAAPKKIAPEEGDGDGEDMSDKRDEKKIEEEVVEIFDDGEKKEEKPKFSNEMDESEDSVLQ